MIARFAPLLLALVALSSCSRLIVVQAEFRGGTLNFVGDDDKKTFYPWCLSHFAIVGTDGNVAWEFKIPLERRDNKRDCGPNLPIAYGVAPSDAVVSTPPQQLRHGQTYIITGYGGGIYEGAFLYQRQMILRRTVDNVSVDFEVRNHALGYDRNVVTDDNSMLEAQR
ncbi:MAG: hypothetical protein ACK4GG_07975 [Sphingomonas sp.]